MGEDMIWGIFDIKARRMASGDGHVLIYESRRLARLALAKLKSNESVMLSCKEKDLNLKVVQVVNIKFKGE